MMIILLLIGIVIPSIKPVDNDSKRNHFFNLMMIMAIILIRYKRINEQMKC